MREKGFTIAEAVTSITILTVALVGLYILAARSIGIGLAFRNELVAANLAIEGVELVRSIRDTNWLEDKTASGIQCTITNWREGLCNGDNRVDYLVPSNGELMSFVDTVLLFDAATGRYSYTLGGTPTLFKRKVNVSDVSANEMRVAVEVRWTGRGGRLCTTAPLTDRCLTVEDRLFNWYGGP